LPSYLTQQQVHNENYGGQRGYKPNVDSEPQSGATKTKYIVLTSSEVKNGGGIQKNLYWIQLVFNLLSYTLKSYS
jgi:hypothetical protein